MTEHTLLITADELAALLASPRPPRVLDVRWRLDRPYGMPDYLAAHLPGAVYADLETQLAGAGYAGDGRHPLPDVGDLEIAARSWGISEGDTVVVYDDVSNLSSARAWWLLTHAGVQDVRLLDGGLRAWLDAGLRTESGLPPIAVGDVSLRYGSLPILDIEDAAVLPSRGVLLDARAPERYRGENEPIDPRAGHIPGARNAPASENYDPSGRFLPPERLRERFEALGVTRDAAVGVYCGSGITAAADAVALTLAGFHPSLYPGSWSQWSNSPERPVAVGDEA
jgi:thiosulfate/3-mercaptopyruvate sulfurtransferase